MSTFAKRAAGLEKAAALLEERQDPLARLMAEEMGKPVTQGKAEAVKCAAACRYYAGQAERMLAPVEREGATLLYQPLGPVLVGLADAMPEGSTQGDRLRSLARTYPNSTISGSAGTVVRSASSRASSYLAALESDAESFERLLATYRDKPQLVKRSLLSNALREIFSNPDIETTFIPPGGQLRLQIGRDLQAAREEEQRAREERTERAARRVPQP